MRSLMAERRVFDGTLIFLLAVLALVVASFARLLWRSLKYGERA